MNVIEYLENNQTKNQIIKLIKDNLVLYQGIDSEIKFESFTGMLYNMFVKECVQNNQYISLSNESIRKIKTQYRFLINQLKAFSENDFDGKLSEIVESHRKVLVKILNSNIYSESTNQVLIPCSEYSDDFQTDILRINDIELLQPIIDVGCGKNCSLVMYLKGSGYTQVFGIDQYESEHNYILTGNWLDFEFRGNTFGTIISHMAFSNHFNRAIVFDDNKIELYIKKYFEILNSLKPGGLFIYTPAIPSIENKLNKEKFILNYYKNTENRKLDTVIIERV
jgi:hypothetical protein